MGFLKKALKKVGGFMGPAGSLGGLLSLGGDAKDLILGTKPEVKTGTMGLWKPWQEKIGKQLGGGMPSLARTSLAGLEDWAKMMATGGGKLGKTADQTLVDIMTQGPQSFEDYYTKVVQDPMLEQYQQEIAPAITRQYAPSGFWSSERLKGEEKSKKDLVTALSRSRAELGYKARESALSRALGAAGLAGERQMLPGRALSIPMSGVLQSMGLRGLENYAVVQPGTQGLLAELIKGVGPGIGMAMAL